MQANLFLEQVSSWQTLSIIIISSVSIVLAAAILTYKTLKAKKEAKNKAGK